VPISIADHCSGVPSSGLGFGFFWRDDDGGRYFVLGFDVEELNALDPATGGADGFGVDADDLAELLMTMSSLASSTRLMPVTLPTLGVAFKTKFPK
jgi:hypothetical protein